MMKSEILENRRRYLSFDFLLENDNFEILRNSDGGTIIRGVDIAGRPSYNSVRSFVWTKIHSPLLSSQIIVNRFE